MPCNTQDAALLAGRTRTRVADVVSKLAIPRSQPAPLKDSRHPSQQLVNSSNVRLSSCSVPSSVDPALVASLWSWRWAIQRACVQAFSCEVGEAPSLRTMDAARRRLSNHSIYSSMRYTSASLPMSILALRMEPVTLWPGVMELRRLWRETPILARARIGDPSHLKAPSHSKIRSCLDTCSGVRASPRSKKVDRTMFARCRLRVCMLTAFTAAWFIARCIDNNSTRHDHVAIGEDT